MSWLKYLKDGVEINEKAVTMKYWDLDIEDPDLKKELKKFKLKITKIEDSPNAGYWEVEITGDENNIKKFEKLTHLSGDKIK